MKQICVCFPRIGTSGVEAPLTESIGDELAAALRVTRPVAMVVGSPVVAVKAFCDDQDDSQLAANALAQGVYYVTGGMAGYHASEIASDGSITELTDPTPGPV